jgi:dephospho-CoA kinase
VIVLAIVGNIGSGKTYISNIFKHFGYKIFNADNCVHKLYKNSRKLNIKVSTVFKLNLKKERINTKDLINIILKKKYLIKKLNNIVHPEVKKKLLVFLKKNKKKNLLILDIPLLLETDFKKYADIVVFVDTKKKKLNFLRKKKKNFNFKLFKILSTFHFKENSKKKLSDFIIYNKSHEENKKQIKKIIDKIILSKE